MKRPVKCPKCKATGQVPRKDLPPMLRGAMGIRQYDDAPFATGQVTSRGSQR